MIHIRAQHTIPLSRISCQVDGIIISGYIEIFFLLTSELVQIQLKRVQSYFDPTV